MTPNNPMFSLNNQLELSKQGCLQKIRAQNIQIWPNGGHFHDFFEKCSKIRFLGRFQNFFDFFLDLG